MHARVLLRLAAPVLQRLGALARRPPERPAILRLHQVVAQSRGGQRLATLKPLTLALVRRPRGPLDAGEPAQRGSLALAAVRHRIVASVDEHLSRRRRWRRPEERVGVVAVVAAAKAKPVVVVVERGLAAHRALRGRVGERRRRGPAAGTGGVRERALLVRGRERVGNEAGSPRGGMDGEPVIRPGRVHRGRDVDPGLGGREVAPQVARLVEGVAGVDAAAAAAATAGVRGRGLRSRAAVGDRRVAGCVRVVVARVCGCVDALVRSAEDEREGPRGDGASGSLARAHARPSVRDSPARRGRSLRRGLEGSPRRIVGDGRVGLEADPAGEAASGGDPGGLERALRREDVAPSVYGRERFPARGHGGRTRERERAARRGEGAEIASLLVGVGARISRHRRWTGDARRTSARSRSGGAGSGAPHRRV